MNTSETDRTQSPPAATASPHRVGEETAGAALANPLAPVLDRLRFDGKRFWYRNQYFWGPVPVSMAKREIRFAGHVDRAALSAALATIKSVGLSNAPLKLTRAIMEHSFTKGLNMFVVGDYVHFVSQGTCRSRRKLRLDVFCRKARAAMPWLESLSPETVAGPGWFIFNDNLEDPSS